MLGKKIILRNEDTIRMNLATTGSFNADFDGDEMNIHVPNSYLSKSEIMNLCNTKWNIMSTQSSKPNIKIVQDGLLGIFLMTNDIKHLTKSQFFQIIIKLDNISFDVIQNKLTLYKKLCPKKYLYTGHTLFSLLLPPFFNLKKSNITIKRGILIEGIITKSVLTSSHNCIIQLLHKEYGEDEAVKFINNVQFLAYAYILLVGFSIGIKDCVVKERTAIKRVITKCIMEAEGIEHNTINPLIREAKINGALSKARDNGMKIAKNALDKSNNFIKTVVSGSKGNFFNIAQIAGLLGQQNMLGQRIMYTLNRGTRALPITHSN